jgi:hypothetical protein
LHNILDILKKQQTKNFPTMKESSLESIDINSFPLDDIRKSAGETKLLSLPERVAVENPCPWTATSSLVASHGFSFRTLKHVKFDPPILVQAPPIGTELPRGSKKERSLFHHVWVQQEETMKALLAKKESGIVACEGEPMNVDDVVFVGNLSQLLGRCNGRLPTLPSVYQILRVNNIIYMASRPVSDGRTVYWEAGTALEEKWTSACDKTIGNYVTFRGSLGENTAFYISQVDALRKEGSMEIVEIKLGGARAGFEFGDFVQCYFKGISQIDCVEEAPLRGGRICSFFKKGKCRNGNRCNFAHENKRVGSAPLQRVCIAPDSFNADVKCLDTFLTLLKETVEQKKTCFLVIETDGSINLLSDFRDDSPWLYVPSFFETLCFAQ